MLKRIQRIKKCEKVKTAKDANKTQNAKKCD